MFFSCKDHAGQEHELIFVRWYAQAHDVPAVFKDRDVEVMYLRWQAASRGRSQVVYGFPKYGMIDLRTVTRHVYILPFFGPALGCAAHSGDSHQRFFLNRYLRCEP